MMWVFGRQRIEGRLTLIQMEDAWVGLVSTPDGVLTTITIDPSYDPDEDGGVLALTLAAEATRP